MSGDLYLDGCTAVAPGLRISLSPSEAKALRLLLNSEGTAVSCRQLEVALYGSSSARQTSNVVAVVVSRLRSKLSMVPGVAISTVRGTGYHLIQRAGGHR